MTVVIYDASYHIMNMYIQMMSFISFKADLFSHVVPSTHI